MHRNALQKLIHSTILQLTPITLMKHIRFRYVRKAAELYDLEATELQKAYNGEKSLSDVCKGLTKQADKLLQE